MNLDNEPANVDVMTDDLDAFNAMLYPQAESGVSSTDDEPVVNTETTEPSEPEEAEKPEADMDEPDASRDSDQDEPEDKEEKPKKTNRVQERINQLLERERKKEEENAALRQRLAELEKQSEPPKAAPVQQEQDGPTPDDKNADGSEKYPLGEFDPQYIRDLTRHTIQKEQAAAREQEAREQAQRQEQEARAALDTQWRDRLSAATEEHEDFLDKTMELEGTFEGLDSQYSDFLVQTIKSLDHGPEVLYYFANNLEEAQKFVRMGPLNAALALGEVNAMFKGQTRKEPKVSKAPPPPQLNKGTNTRKVIAPDTDNLDDFETLLFNKSRK